MLSTSFLLRLVDEEGYRAFLRGEITDLQLADSFFEIPWAKPLRGSYEANAVEATLMMVAEQRQPDGTPGNSELLARCRRNVNESGSARDRARASSEQIDFYDSFSRASRRGGQRWRDIVQRIEMLASAR